MRLKPVHGEIVPRVYSRKLLNIVDTTIFDEAVSPYDERVYKAVLSLILPLLIIIGLLVNDIAYIGNEYIKLELQRIREQTITSVSTKKESKIEVVRVSVIDMPQSEKRDKSDNTDKVKRPGFRIKKHKTNIFNSNEFSTTLNKNEYIEKKINTYFALNGESKLTGLPSYKLANLYSKNDLWYKASLEYKKACRILMLNPDCFFNLAVSLDHQGLYKSALLHYSKAMSLSSSGEEKLDSVVLQKRINTLSRKLYARTAASKYRAHQ